MGLGEKNQGNVLGSSGRGNIKEADDLPVGKGEEGKEGRKFSIMLYTDR